MNHMETSKENMQKTTVGRASEHLVQCDVKEPRSVLRYERTIQTVKKNKKKQPYIELIPSPPVGSL